MQDILKIKKNISKIKRIVIFLLILLCISIPISYFLTSVFFKIKPRIKNDIKLDLINNVFNIKDLDIASVFSINTIQIGNGKMLNIESDKTFSFKNKTLDGFENIVTLPEFKKRIFKGKTDYIKYNMLDSNLKIPNRMKLDLVANPIYYILTNNFYGNLESGNYNSDKSFIINDIDFYISGDSFDTKSNLDYIMVSGNSIFKQRDKLNRSLFVFEIYSDISEIFNTKNFAEFFRNVKMIYKPKNSKVDSRYTKAIFHFDKNGELSVDEMLFLDNVSVTTDGQISNSNIGFYNLKKNKIILLGDVKIKDIKNETITKSGIYIYDTETGVGNSGMIYDIDDIFYPNLKNRILTLIPRQYNEYRDIISDLNFMQKRSKIVMKH